MGDYGFSGSASTLSLKSWSLYSLIDWIFLNLSHLLLHSMHSRKQLPLNLRVWIILFESFDLPQFNRFEVRQAAFTDTTSITLNSRFGIRFLLDVPFTGGYYSVESGSSFQSITCASFTVTGTSALPNKMKSC